jgi:hypothetical protein
LPRFTFTELWVGGIFKQYRNRGHGDALIKEASIGAPTYGTDFFARCFPQSVTMLHILKRNSFRVIDTPRYTDTIQLLKGPSRARFQRFNRAL